MQQPGNVKLHPHWLRGSRVLVEWSDGCSAVARVILAIPSRCRLLFADGEKVSYNLDGGLWYDEGGKQQACTIRPAGAQPYPPDKEEIAAYLVSIGLPSGYAETVAGDLSEAVQNGDERPLWYEDCWKAPKED